MTRLNIKLTDRILKDSQTYRFEERREGELDFRSTSCGERLTFTDVELATAVGKGELEILHGSQETAAVETLTACRVGDFTMLSDGERARARNRLAYVVAAQRHGNRCMSETVLKSIIAETARQQTGEKEPSTRQLRRWLRMTGPAPVASHFVSSNRAKGNRVDRLDFKVRKIIEERIDRDSLKRPPIKLTTLHDYVRADVVDLNRTAVPQVKVPSYKAVRAAVACRSPRDLMAARKGEAAAAHEFDPVSLQKDPEAPLDVVELDHTPTDLMVICERTRLPLGRPTVAAMIDRCTRMPLGIYLGFEPPSVHTVVECLRNGMLPKTYVDQKVARGEWAIKHRWDAFGKPRTLLLDRALENIGTDLDDLAAELRMHMRIAPRKSGNYKGAIERFVKELNYSLLHEQPGTTFANIMDRDDYDPAKNAVITHDRLLYVLHRWVVDVYANGPHRGIMDAPAKLWDEKVVKYPVEPVSNIMQFDMLLGRTDVRILDRCGLEFRGLFYSSDRLVALLTDPDFVKRFPKHDVTFRYGAGCLGSVRAYDPIRREYLEVPVQERFKDYATGLSIWQHQLIRKYRTDRMKANSDTDGMAEAKVALAEEFRQAGDDRKKMRGRKKAARHDGVGRLAPAGTDESTSPIGSQDHARRAAVKAVTSAPSSQRQLGMPTKGKRPHLTVVGESGSRLLKPTPVRPLETAFEDDVDLYAKKGITRDKE